MAVGDFTYNFSDPLDAARRRNRLGYAFPAITDFSLPGYQRTLNGQSLPNLTPTTYRATFQQSVPVGGFGLGALSQAGYSRSPNVSLGQFFNQRTVAQPVTTGLPRTQYTLPGVNADIRALSDPSVNALAGAQRTTNAYGQQVVNPAGGGQIISGAGPTVGSLGNNRTVDLNTGQQTINTPSGGQIISGPSRFGTQPRRLITQGQVRGFGGWY